MAPLSESQFLSVKTEPKQQPAGSPARMLQDTADASYEVLLRALDYVFSQGKNQRGAMLEAARRAMYNIDDACRSLSELGLGALFTLPRPAPAAATPHEIGKPLRPHIEAMRESKRPEMVALADRMDGKLADLAEGIESAAKAH